MRLAMLPNFPCPNIADITLMGILIHSQSSPSIMCNLAFEGCDEMRHKLLGKCIIRYKLTCR